MNDNKEPQDMGADGEGWTSRVVPDLVKRLFVAGMGAFLTSEEGIRRLATEFSLPKEVASYLVTQAQTTKSELFRVVAREIRSFLESINLGAELTKILTSLTFEVKMQIRLLPSDKGNAIVPQVKGDLKVLKQDEEEEVL
jgi:hypothetical protein